MAGKRAVPDHLANFSILKYWPQTASFALAAGSPRITAASRHEITDAGIMA
jgi:hypothetical protein